MERNQCQHKKNIKKCKLRVIILLINTSANREAPKECPLITTALCTGGALNFIRTPYTHITYIHEYYEKYEQHSVVKYTYIISVCVPTRPAA